MLNRPRGYNSFLRRVAATGKREQRCTVLTAGRARSHYFMIGFATFQQKSCLLTNNFISRAVSNLTLSSKTTSISCARLSVNELCNKRIARTFAVMAVSEINNPMLDIVRVPMFESNYGWLLRDRESNTVAAVDPAQPDAIRGELERRSWKLDYILNTHHHHDHVGGNKALKEAYNCTVVGSQADAHRIPLMDRGVSEGDVVQVGSAQFQVLDTPGHTLGHITFWEPSACVVFPGDTIFALGCGRLFEGTAHQMWHSLSKIKALPEKAEIFCAHEYTEANARWATSLEPENEELMKRQDIIMAQRSQDIPTIPSILGDEIRTNPFLRPDSIHIRKRLGIPDDAPNEVAFKAIREHKDSF